MARKNALAAQAVAPSAVPSSNRNPDTQTLGKASAGVLVSRPAIDSTAKGGTVARRRFQRGSVYQNRTKAIWLGSYSEYILDSNGVEKRKRKYVVLGPIRKPDGEEM